MSRDFRQTNRGESPDLYFLRDSQGLEIDLLIKRGSSYIPVEIKSAETFSVDFISNLSKFRQLMGTELLGGYVVYGGTESFTVEETNALPANDQFAKILTQ